MFFKILAVSAFVASAVAIPDVTAKQLPAGCSSYPGYQADSNTAGPWTVQVSNSDNPAIEGFSDTSVYSIAVNGGRPSLRWGYVSPPSSSPLNPSP